VAGVPVAVCADARAGRDAAERIFARYGGLENYWRLLARENVASPGALAVVGAEDDVAKQLRRYADVGVTELWATVFGVGEDAAASLGRTRALLVELGGDG
jgi:alkanesulfonate monooxygenase SsuD/methylene tetrahydromethanopterin reductase-like flavin-dependent oxidoreductase (luciferase family)